ncbi:family 39 glycoside hydrolase [Xylogone sp. PMI_703]|nr:family 39 glycoside hydrolase [Xylogone sp. PMI_703]
MSFPVSISVHVDQKLKPLHPIYRFFGADEPNYAYMKDGKKLISKLGKLGSEQVFFRAHNLLTTGKGVHDLKWGSTNIYTEDKDGNPIYDFTIVDQIFDTYLERNVKPYVQLGFMPEAMSTKPVPYKHSWTPYAPYHEIYTGWAYPPKDYEKWSELIYQWTKHCVEKYGKAECESWYWEVWNEPNIGYWQGTPEEFYKLYDYAVAGVHRALPTAKVGGPETADGGPEYLRGFFDHCVNGINCATGEKGSQLDFLSFHAKGKPTYENGHVIMDVSRQLRIIDSGFEIVASFPELKDKPIVLGESDPEGAAAAQGPQLGYRNGTMYSSYTAASFVRKHDLADKHGVNLEGALTWAFEFEDQPFFAGFRVLASNDIDLPVLNVFRMFAKMGGVRLEAHSSAQLSLDDILSGSVRKDADVGVLASLEGKKLYVFIWHYHDEDVPGPIANVSLELDGVQVNADNTITHYRIDEKYSNAYTIWKEMGSPQKPTEEQYVKLTQAGQLAHLPTKMAVDVKDNKSVLGFELPRQGVSLLVIDL